MSAQIPLENLLADGQIDQVLEIFIDLARQYQDDARAEQGIIQSGRYRNLLQQEREGAISHDDFLVEQTRIRKSVLALIQEIPSHWETPQKIAPIPVPVLLRPRSQKQTIRLVLVMIAGLFAFFIVQKWLLAPKEIGAGPSPNPSLPDAPKETAQTRPPTTDQKFRSYANMQLSEGMELGFVGEKAAFRNLKTQQIICCFDEASPFKNGKAAVKNSGQSYFINPNGERIP